MSTLANHVSEIDDLVHLYSTSGSEQELRDLIWWREFSNAWRVIGLLCAAQFVERYRASAVQCLKNDDFVGASMQSSLANLIMKFAAEYKP